MSFINNLARKFFGSKADKDIEEIQPYRLPTDGLPPHPLGLDAMVAKGEELEDLHELVCLG